jgi:D-sedoheptulose 7-phosphate isomerase
MIVTVGDLLARVDEALHDRNRAAEAFFAREADRLAAACHQMSERFLQGGRLLAFGRGPYATDAQHVAVEFVHPVIVGKRALPALDVSAAFGAWLTALPRAEDIVMGFAPPEGDPEVAAALAAARARGAMTLALPGRDASYGVEAATTDPFVHQEIVEILYHTLWETVHVFFEHRPLGHDVGEAGFLYPFLGRESGDARAALPEVASSIRLKAADVAALRSRIARDQRELLVEAARGIRRRLADGGQIITFGNGGSATDANDLAIDCVAPPAGLARVPAVSLSLEPASLTAIANDVGHDVVFLRQLVAQARPHDVAIVFSTSGGSRNIVMALEEARRRGLMTVAFVGYDGGQIGRQQLADVTLVVGSDYIPRIQEAHASMYHIVRGLIGEDHDG